MMKNMKGKLRNARGFTLVELLAVIVILGIIAAIAVPSIGGIIENTKEKATESEKTMIIEAARLAYAADDTLFDDDKATSEELEIAGYLEDTDSDYPDITVVYTSGTGFEIQE